jgi:hypothetical protein
MPMKRENYPVDWEAISLRIRKERALDRCECTGQCDLHDARCDAINTQPHPVTGSKVVLTVAHLDQDTWHNEDDNLCAMCQRCHLVYDRGYYKKQRLAWVKTLTNTDLNVLLASIDSYSIDVIGNHFDAQAKAIWGDDYMESLDKIRTVLQDEWDDRNEPPLEDILDIG